MPKKCSCGCNRRVFSKGLCKPEWQKKYGKPLKRTAIKKNSANNSIRKPRKPINKISDKHAKELRKYSKLRKTAFTEDDECDLKLPVCTHIATEWHHTKGRGKNLLNTKKLKKACHSCHAWVTEHSKEAIEMGLSERRNTPIDRDNTT